MIIRLLYIWSGWPVICLRCHVRLVMRKKEVHFFSCYTSVSLKAQPLWSIRRDGHNVCRALTLCSLKPVKWRWAGRNLVAWKRRRLPQPSSSSPDVNSLSSQVEQSHWASAPTLPCLNSAYRGMSGNERAIYTTHSTSTSPDFVNIKPQSGTFMKHIMTI